MYHANIAYTIENMGIFLSSRKTKPAPAVNLKPQNRTQGSYIIVYAPAYGLKPVPSVYPSLQNKTLSLDTTTNIFQKYFTEFDDACTDLEQNSISVMRLLRVWEIARTIEAEISHYRKANNNTAANPVPEHVYKVEGKESYKQKLWSLSVEKYEKVKDAWENIITDPLNALEYSSLFDVKYDKTALFVQTYTQAQDMFVLYPYGCDDERVVEKFNLLTNHLERTWLDAYVFAQRRGVNWLPAEEQKYADRAQKLLRLANDENSSVHERLQAATRAIKMLEYIESFLLPQESITKMLMHKNNLQQIT